MSDDDKRSLPWPDHSNPSLRLVAAWIALGVLIGSVVSVLFNWLFCLTMNRLIGADFCHFDPLWSCFFGACFTGTFAGGFIAWVWPGGAELVSKRSNLVFLVLMLVLLIEFHLFVTHGAIRWDTDAAAAAQRATADRPQKEAGQAGTWAPSWLEAGTLIGTNLR